MDKRRSWVAVVAWGAGLVAATAGLGGVLAIGGAWSRKLDVFTHLAPVWGLLGLLAIALWLLAGRPGRLAPALGAIEIVCCLVLMAPELIAAARPVSHVPAGAERLKLLQFNVWKANVDVEATLDYIRQSGADIVTLQEVVGSMADADARLADAYPYSFKYRGQNAYPVAVLSKHPILHKAPLRITSGVRVGFETAAGHPFEVITTHYLWPTDLGQLGQQIHLIDQLAGADRRGLILTGDMNSTPWSFSLRRQDREFGLERRTRALWSWPARLTRRLGFPLPVLPIDQVYAGQDWTTVAVRRGPRVGSDHYPVLVELAWTGAP